MNLLFCALLTLLLTTPVLAASTMDFYTDRQAFDQRVGDYTSLTLDAPDPGTFPCSYSQSSCNVTYDNGLVNTAVDSNPGCGIVGYICFASFFPGAAWVNPPVYAFGFDVTGAMTFLPDNSNILQADAILLNHEVTVSEGQFYGWVSDTPFHASVETTMLQSSDIWWSMDNLAIRTTPFQTVSTQATTTTVPEPSTVLLLGLGLVGLLVWTYKVAMMRMLFCALLVLVSGCVGGSLTTTGSGIMYDKDGKPMGIPLVQHCILGEQTKDLDGSTWETKGCSWDGATGMLSVKQVRKP